MTAATLPLYVLTGFLGSGKTTLLRTLLRHGDFRDTAVIVNEFGEVGLDHDLLEASEDDMVVLQGGCVCCTVREDLASTIRRLVERRTKGETPDFSRLVIETTGIADPVPVIFTLRTDPRVRQLFEFKGLIVTVDAQNGVETLAHYVEATRQAALADRIVITKTDLASPDEVAALAAQLQVLNPSASLIHSSEAGLPPRQLLDGLDHDAPNLADMDVPAEGRHDHYAHAYRSISWTGTERIDWSIFGIWLTLLLHRHGGHILRVKGILDVEGAKGPVAIHGVQHIVHPPVHLEAWPDGARRSRLVFIVSGIAETEIRRSFETFLRLAKLPAAPGNTTMLSGSSGGMIGGRPVRRPMAPAWLKG